MSKKSDNFKYKETVAEIMRSDKEAFAEIITEWLQPNHLTTEVLSLLLDTRSLKPGDLLVKKIRKGIEVRTLVPGAVHLASEITVSDRMNFVLDGADVKVTFNEWELDRGEIGTIDSIANEMKAKLRDYYVNKVFTALSTVWTAGNTPSNYTSVGGTLTASALEDAIDQINNTTPGAKLVVGARQAVSAITKFGAFWTDGSNVGYSEELIKRIFDNGWLGKYYGVPVLALEQVYDNLEDYNTLIPTDKVLVIGEKVGEFITYGEEKRKQWTDMSVTPPQWMMELYQQFGMIIDNAMGIYVLGNIS